MNIKRNASRIAALFIIWFFALVFRPAVSSAWLGNSALRWGHKTSTISNLLALLAGDVSGTTGTNDGTGPSARFDDPVNMSTDANGNVYVADSHNNLIRKITPAGVVTTVAGDGSCGSTDANGTAASFCWPLDVVVDSAGNLFVSDADNSVIRKIDTSGNVTTFAGQVGTKISDLPPSSPTQLAYPARDSAGNLLISDFANSQILKLTPAGVVSVFAGSTAGYTDATGTAAAFSGPMGIAFDSSENLFVADGGNNVIRKITPAGVVTTFAGDGSCGTADGNGTAASLCNPMALTIDSADNIYFSDSTNFLIRKITPLGDVTTIAGDGTEGSIDGTGTAARISGVYGMVTDASGTLYFSEFNFSSPSIRKITSGNVVSTIALSATGTYVPFRLAVSSSKTYIVDTLHHTLLVEQSGTIQVLAGNGSCDYTDGSRLSAGFCMPYDAAVDGSGNLYVVDNGNNVIRKVTPAGAVTTFAGDGSCGHTDGTGIGASFCNPTSIILSSSGDLLVGDENVVRRITFSGVVTTLAGDGTCGATNGPVATAEFCSIVSLAENSAGDLLVLDSTNNLIRKIASGTVSTFAGDGTCSYTDATGTAASFCNFADIAFDASDNAYIADGNCTIRKITPAGVTTTFAGNDDCTFADGTGTAAGFSSMSGIEYNSDTGSFLVPDFVVGAIRSVDLGAVTDTVVYPIAPTVQFSSLAGLALDSSGNLLVSDFLSGTIFKMTSLGDFSILAGHYDIVETDGTGINASFIQPIGMTIDASDNLYVLDSPTGHVRKVTSSGVVTTLAVLSPSLGDGSGTSAAFESPGGMTIDSADNIYVADILWHSIRKISPSGYVETIAGKGTCDYIDDVGTAAAFCYPYDVAVDATGNLYVADYENYLIRKIDPSKTVTTFVGNYGSSGSTDGTGTAAEISGVNTIGIDPSSGNIFLGDDYTIRKVTPAGTVSTLIGVPNTPGILLGALPGRLDLVGGLAFFGSNLYISSGQAVLKSPIP